MPEKLPEQMHLTPSEYYALQDYFGVVSILSTHLKHLEKRAKSIPGVWRDLRMMQTVSDRVLKKILPTIPAKKLALIHKNLKHTKISVKVDWDVTGKKDPTFVYVPEDELYRMVARVVNYECLFCEKSRADMRRCEIRKDFEALYPYDVTGDKDTCPLVNANIPASKLQRK